MARGIPLVIIDGSWMDPCEGKGPASWDSKGPRLAAIGGIGKKWGRNKLPDNDIDGLSAVCLGMPKQTGSIDGTLYDFQLARLI